MKYYVAMETNKLFIREYIKTFNISGEKKQEAKLYITCHCYCKKEERQK